jgi:biopolymer transport protein ExbD
MSIVFDYSGRRWRRFYPRSRLFRNPMPVAAFLNVAFVLVLFMVVDSAFVLKPGMIVELPAAEFVSGSHFDARIVTLTQEGKVFFDDEWMPLDELAFAFKRAAHRKEDLSLIIEADARVPYGTVVRVMNMAAEARIRRINLATRPFAKENKPDEFVT